MMHPDPDVIEAGRLRHVVEVQQESDVANAPGEQVATWHTVVTLRAEVDAASGAGSETTAEGGTVTLAAYKVKHRYYAPLTTAMRYLWDETVLNIVATGEGARRIGQISSCISRG